MISDFGIAGFLIYVYNQISKFQNLKISNF